MNIDQKKHLAIEIYQGKRLGFVKKLYYKWMIPSTNAVYLIRRYQWSKNRLLSLYFKWCLIKKFGIMIGKKTVIGIGLQLPHPIGIVIGESVIIGENCIIYQQVTIGGARRGDYLRGNQPYIGNDCVLFAGSKILGDIQVRNKSCIAANAVLISDTEEESTYAGVPANKIT